MRIERAIAAMAGVLLGGSVQAVTTESRAPSSDSRWGAQADSDAHGVDRATGSPPAVAARTCVAFENEDYRGRRLVAIDGAAMEWVGRSWNDRISSVACASGCRLIAYQTIVFGGARANFTGARPSLGPVWNDRISALRVACDGDHSAADQDH